MSQDHVQRESSVPLRFDGLFRSSPGMYLVLKPDFSIEDASGEYARATLIGRDEVRGCGLFEIFPDNPHDPAADGVRNLRASLLQVVKLGRPHRMPIQRYDVRDRVRGEGAWVERYWAPVNMPVFGGGSREITHVIHQVEDVTGAVLRERRLGGSSHPQGEQPSALVETIQVRPQLPGPTPCASAGQRAPVSGIWNVFHERGCEMAPDRLSLRVGQAFPRCARCQDGVFYRLLRQRA